MHMQKKWINTALLAGVLVILCSCAVPPQGNPPPGGAAESKVAVAASFRQEDGAALCGGTARLSFGENYVDYPVGDDGKLNITGLPRAGNWILTVLDRQEQVRGAMTLSLSEGAVIDASTDDSGVGYITLRGDTDEIALLFMLKNDGSLLCTLHLSSPPS